MAQDCVQTLEKATFLVKTPGCRFTDSLRLCYIYDTAQNWCLSNLDNSYCGDGGESWAIPPLGTSANGQYKTEFVPKKDVEVAGNYPGEENYNCACMKNCACTSKE